jgi:hypothetical protein
MVAMKKMVAVTVGDGGEDRGRGGVEEERARGLGERNVEKDNGEIERRSSDCGDRAEGKGDEEPGRRYCRAGS